MMRLKRNKGESDKWRKRFLVATEGKIAHYKCVKDFFLDSSTEPIIEVSIDLNSSHVILLQSNPPPPGLQSEKDRLEARLNSWGVMDHGTGRKLEIDTLPAADMKEDQPTSRGRSSSDATFQFGIFSSPLPLAGELKKEWLDAIALAMPNKVFGVPLSTARERSDFQQTLVPAPIRVCTTWLNQHGLQEEGLYRIPGSKEEVNKFIRQFDQGLDVEIPELYFAGNVASLIVQFLRQMPESLFSNKLAPVFEQVSEEVAVNPAKLPMLKKLVGMLPADHFCTIKMLIEHLVNVSTYSETNQMTGEKLAMCVYTQMAQTFQMLIMNCDFIFDQPVPALPEAEGKPSPSPPPSQEQVPEQDQEVQSSPRASVDPRESASSELGVGGQQAFKPEMFDRFEEF